MGEGVVVSGLVGVFVGLLILFYTHGGLGRGVLMTPLELLGLKPGNRVGLESSGVRFRALLCFETFA